VGWGQEKVRRRVHSKQKAMNEVDAGRDSAAGRRRRRGEERWGEI
jgi:hypothetical protein